MPNKTHHIQLPRKDYERVLALYGFMFEQSHPTRGMTVNDLLTQVADMPGMLFDGITTRLGLGVFYA